MFASNTSQVSSDATYIEDVFSTWLYTGNGSTQTITNGIDLAGKGGMTWLKSRSTADANGLFDTARGISAGYLQSENTGAQSGSASQLTSFNASGFTLPSTGYWNTSAQNLVSWTFRKQPKFFDVVTYTGNGAGTRALSHSLGSVPGCMILKRTDSTGNWQVYHQNLTTPNASAASNALLLNDTVAGQNSSAWGSTAPTSTQFTVGSSQNTNGATYVAYLFAHDAGGFGLTGTDNVISCGSFTENGSTQNINLGYEPQWIMTKLVTGNEDWIVFDNMRGWSTYPGPCNDLNPNTSAAETTINGFLTPTSTGFRTDPYAGSGNTYIYIAIRRGPMKTPTSGTSVFSPNTTTNGNQSWTPNFPVDLLFDAKRTTGDIRVGDRLRGNGTYLVTSSTAAENASAGAFLFDAATGTMQQATFSGPGSYVMWNFRRAPGFFDVVCYTGTGSATTVNHNLGVAPELMIVKRRNSSTYGDWYVYAASQGATKFLLLNTTDAVTTNSGPWNNTAPTASVFTAGSDLSINSTATYVAYLFASCPGVSKVGSYTGTGATQTISCGFAARFVLIKRTDSTGSWFVWDTARGMVAGTDPRLALNSNAAETNANWVYTNASGFQIVTTDATVNASGGSYIFLAIS